MMKESFDTNNSQESPEDAYKKFEDHLNKKISSIAASIEVNDFEKTSLDGHEDDQVKLELDFQLIEIRNLSNYFMRSAYKYMSSGLLSEGVYDLYAEKISNSLLRLTNMYVLTKKELEKN